MLTFLTYFVPNVSQARTQNLPGLSINVPMFNQSTYYTCGPASSMSVLKYFGLGKGNNEMYLANLMKTSTETGTRFWNLAEVLNQRGLSAVVYTGLSIADLRNALRKNQAVIINFDYDGGHYVVLAGMDNTHVYFMDPWYTFSTYQKWEIPHFEAQWYDSHDGVRYERLGIIIDKARRRSKLH